MNKFLAVTVAVAISTAVFIPTQASAQVAFNVVIGNAPPPLRYEVVPAARRGYEWSPGYWNWDGKRHQWSQGHWERVRPGYVYQRSEWRQEGDRWQLNRGGWTRGEIRREQNVQENRRSNDRDHDGVPNRNDRHPDNPYRD